MVLFNNNSRTLSQTNAQAQENGVILPHSGKVLFEKDIDLKIKKTKSHISHLTGAKAHRTTHGGKRFQARQISLRNQIQNASKRLTLLNKAKVIIVNINNKSSDVPEMTAIPVGDFSPERVADGDSSGKVIGKITNSEGDIYEGELLDNKPSGKGEITFKNGDYYVGEFLNGKSLGKGKGKGKITSAEGEIYVGELFNGKPSGKGEIFFKNGDYCEGEFLKGYLLGKGEGRLTNFEGHIYEGEIFNGKPSGIGRLIDSDGKILGYFRNFVT